MRRHREVSARREAGATATFAATVVLCAPAVLAAEQVPPRCPWPFAPADQPHPVASRFHTPMHTSDESSYLHGGLDIVKPAGTAILAVVDGYVWIYRDRGHDNVLLTEQDGTTWEYRHVAIGSIPAAVHEAADRGEPVRQGAKLGEVGDRWSPNYEHVHLNLRGGDGRILNPLDRLLPLADTRAPEIRGIRLLPDGGDRPYPVAPDGTVVVAGEVDIAVDARDGMEGTDFTSPPLAFSWRIGRRGEERRFDPFPGRLPERAGWPAPRYPELGVDAIYLLSGPVASVNPTFAPRGQRWVAVITNVDGEGHVDGSGAWDTTRLTDGEYEIHVTARDHVGNAATASVRTRVSNSTPPPVPRTSGFSRPEPLAFDYLAIHPRDEVRHRFTFLNRGPSPLSIEDIESPAGGHVVSFDRTVQPERRGEVTVVLSTADLAERRSRHEFRVAGEGIPRRSLVLSLEIFPTLEARPETLELAIDADGTASSELVLRSTRAIDRLDAAWKSEHGVQPARLVEVRRAGPFARLYRIVIPRCTGTNGVLVIDGPQRLMVPGRPRER